VSAFSIKIDFPEMKSIVCHSFIFFSYFLFFFFQESKISPILMFASLTSSPQSLRIVLELNLSFSISLYFARMFSKNRCALSPSEPYSAVSFLQASISANIFVRMNVRIHKKIKMYISTYFLMFEKHAYSKRLSSSYVHRVLGRIMI